VSVLDKKSPPVTADSGGASPGQGAIKNESQFAAIRWARRFFCQQLSDSSVQTGLSLP